MKPRPQTPPAGTSPAQSPVQTPTNPSSRLFRNTTSPSPAPGPGPGHSADPDSGSSGAPGTATPPRPPNFSSSYSSPPASTTPATVAPSSSATSNLGRPTVTRLGPPKPANMTRLRHVESAHPSQSRSTSQPSTPTPTALQTQVTGLQGSPQLRNVQQHGRTSSTSDVSPANRTALNGLLRASTSGQSLDKFTLDGGNVTLRTRSYKPGFQPPGVRSTRTQEFDEARRRVGEERGREEGRLGRRWAKLIDLHFNPMAGPDGPTNASASTSAVPSTPPNAGKPSPSRPRLTPQISERFNALTNTLDQVTPKDVWRGFRSVTGVGLEQVELEKKREVERGLVVWEEDGEVRRCRICQSIFSLTNRKHHCRLCGRIVCSLPPTPATILALAAPSSSTSSGSTKTGLPLGTRRETCSLLLVADYRTGKGHEVDEGFVGWMQMGSGAGVSEQGRSGSSTATAIARRPDEVQVKGVRTCRECWGVISRKQKMADMRQVSRFSRLYGALKSLEAEIADALPEYQDRIQDLRRADDDDSIKPSPGGIPPELMTLHKHLLALFAEYDAFTKRIRSYPCSPLSAQERVQQAIARQAGLFMAKEAGTLQLLPKLQAQRHKRATSSAAVSIDSSIAPAPPIVDETATLLQPLLEQEAQLETFIAEANAQRKLEDARTLLISLEELRQEIARIAAGVP
ncbi:FYVE zinc finger-domain-containing protein [Filobasidium floriforme]|uniref:FYVE zinc finger-domain-containing protein n=1 Tax=Filobasidium floriforme TaxID=5210 RepID=UPI001E8EACA9|nr:FYVE zinc finger-domain-containing protein [Filobasidium floriforme]KAH8087968.1 FYVE zinc finger-domain-containing protein [Filobasidium floriforme]